MKILITGSEGNIGKKLVSHLEKKGHDVYGVDIKQSYRKNYSVIDVVNPVDLNKVYKNFKPDVTFHLAAMVSRITCEESPSLTILTNVTGTANIAQLCKNYDSKMINFSTSEIYGNIGGILSEERTDVSPNNIYGLSKLLAEKVVNYEKTNGLIATNVRPFMIYDENETLGEHRSAIIRFCEDLLREKSIVVHKGAKRGWLHVNDAVKIFEKLMYSTIDTVNVGHPIQHDVSEIAHKICNILDLSYNEYVVEEDLPCKMTLVKSPDLSNQKEKAPIRFEYDVMNDMKYIIDVVRQRINN